MKKNVIILVLVITILVVVLGWWFFFRDKAEVIIPVEQKGPIGTEGIEESVITQEPLVFIKIDQTVVDSDMDGLSDEEETALGLSNSSFDTDGDGISDMAEIRNLGTNPNKIDTDGDGFSDGIELMNGYNPLGEGKIE